VLFTEPTFLFLFLPALLGLYFLPWQRHRNWLLLIASLLFYAKGGGTFTWLVMASIAFNYSAALWIDRRRGTEISKWLLRGAVAINLLVLGIFKYANFIGDNLNAALVALGVVPLTVPKVVLPIGISFFTFHAISYIVDVHRRDAVAQKRPVEAALYLLLFPQLIAGPIIRYREIASQLASRLITSDDLAYGIRRFVIGLAKKMLVANVVAGPADRIFAMPTPELTAAHAWIAVACYTLQIYFDFSGYSDMAIGLGRMFGFRFPENFRYPYIAKSVREFWRRWHISLSAWFRDYVYLPLGGNRASASRVYVNLVAVFFLCGLWHGASWTFVVWGLFHGAFLIIERLGLGKLLSTAPRVVGHAYLLLVVMIGWVFFRAETLSGAIGMLRAMIGLGAGAPTAYAPAWYLTKELLVCAAAGIVGSTPIIPALSRRPARFASLAETASLLVLLVTSVMLIAARTYNPFIYFRF
jgi:alginate O-acetyltransferase complex protein AlgI